MDMVFCSTARNHGIIDFAVMRAGVLVGEVSGETIDEVGKRYPGAYLTTYDSAIALQASSLITAPVEITEEVFIDALECLPPMDWKGGGNAESFKMCEFTSGTITCIYVRIGKRYFSMQDSAFLSHDEIIAKVTASLKGGIHG